MGTRYTNEWDYGADHVIKMLQGYRPTHGGSFWTSQLSYTKNLRHVDARLTRGGPLMEAPATWSINFQLRNRASSQTSWTTNFTAGATEDGGLTNQFEGHITFRPGPRWQLSIDPSLLRQVDTQQYVSTVSGGRPDDLQQPLHLRDNRPGRYSTQFRLGYTLKPDLNLDVYAEPFAASGNYYDLGELAAVGSRQRLDYGTNGTTLSQQADGSYVVSDGAATFKVNNNDFNVRSFRSNVVLRWEYRPGSTIYLVWQQNRRIQEPTGSRISLGDPFRSLTEPGNNYFVIKTSFWLPVR